MNDLIENLVPLVSVLAPFALIFFIFKMRHDRNMRQMNLQGLSQDEQRALSDMSETARRMEQRIENLERILDSEIAGWRSRLPL
jgi:phage shock protein B